jgi:hypothetical protein
MPESTFFSRNPLKRQNSSPRPSLFLSSTNIVGNPCFKASEKTAISQPLEREIAGLVF